MLNEARYRRYMYNNMQTTVLCSQSNNCCRVLSWLPCTACSEIVWLLITIILLYMDSDQSIIFVNIYVKCFHPNIDTFRSFIYNIHCFADCLVGKLPSCSAQVGLKYVNFKNTGKML